MQTRIAWPANPELGVASYVLERSPASTGPFALLATVTADQSGANWDAAAQSYFYDDTTTVAGLDWYRLIAVDRDGLQSYPSDPFHVTAGVPGVTTTVRVDHHYGAPDALRYQTPAGSPIDNAVISIFRKFDYDLGAGVPLATLYTTSEGRWAAPVFLAGGFVYVVHFQKAGLFGPDTTEITV